MATEVIIQYWPQVTALLFLVFWISRTISELKGHNDRQDEQIKQNSEKVKNLFEIWNHHVDRLLDEARRGKK